MERAAERVVPPGWVESESGRTQGILDGAWKQRRRYAVDVEPAGPASSEVTVRLRVEERAPGGTRAARWRSAEAPPEMADAMLAKIREEVKK